MKTTKDKINEIKNYGYDLDFSEVFNHAFETYKKIALNAGLAFIIFAFVMFILIIGIAVVAVGTAAATQTLTDFKLGNLSTAYIIIYIVGVSLLTGFINPFFAGIIKMAHSAEIGEEFSVGTSFDYYKGRYFMELFLATLYISLFTVGLSTGVEVIGSPGLSLLVTFLNMIVSLLSLMVIPLIIFGDLKAMDAITTSFALVVKKPWIILGLVIVAGLAAMIGLIAFCIGIFFTLPLIYAMYYSIYVHAVGIEDRSEINEIGASME